jgi:hypothetical protein
MSFLSKPVYLNEDARGWQNTEHPVIAFMHDYEQAFDFGDMKKTGPARWVTDDYVFVHSSGKEFHGIQSAWEEGVLASYGPFAAHYHEPQRYVIWETDGGYKLIGVAKLYTNLPVPGENKCKDLEGREWDCVGNGAFEFEYVKDKSAPMGMKLRVQAIYADPLGMMSEMVARKMATPDDLFAMHNKLAGA